MQMNYPGLARSGPSSNVPESPATRARRLQLEEAERALLPQQAAPAASARPASTPTMRVPTGPQAGLGPMFRQQDSDYLRKMLGLAQSGVLTPGLPSGAYGIDPTTGKPLGFGGVFKAPVARLFGGETEPNFADKLAWWVGGRPFYPTQSSAEVPVATPTFPLSGSTFPLDSVPTGGYGLNLPNMDIPMPNLDIDWAGLYPEAGF